MGQERMLRKISCVGISALLVIGLAGCDQGPTSGGDDRFEGTQFVGGDETTGRIVVDVEETEIRVGANSSFSVAVYDSKGRPVPNISVSCGPSLVGSISVIEPAGGADITNSRGVMSGVLQCSTVGSYQFGCRLANGADRRQFVGIKCVLP